MSATLSLASVLAESARRRPQQTALVQGDLRLTYAEVDRRVDRLAAGLRARGIRPGDRVAIHMENRPEYIVAYFAIPASGAVTVLDWSPRRHFTEPDSSTTNSLLRVTTAAKRPSLPTPADSFSPTLPRQSSLPSSALKAATVPSVPAAVNVPPLTARTSGNSTLST